MGPGVLAPEEVARTACIACMHRATKVVDKAKDLLAHWLWHWWDAREGEKVDAAVRSARPITRVPSHTSHPAQPSPPEQSIAQVVLAPRPCISCLDLPRPCTVCRLFLAVPSPPSQRVLTLSTLRPVNYSFPCFDLGALHACSPSHSVKP